MKDFTESHAREKDLERYATGALEDDRLEPLEQHLLICAPCRARLQETEEFIGALRIAARNLRLEQMPLRETAWGNLSRVFSFPKPVWIGSLSLIAALMLFFVFRLGEAPRNLSPATVILQAYRGDAGLAGSRAPAGRTLSLTVDATELPPSGSYGLEIVDRTGGRVWEGQLAASEGKLALRVQKLRKGRYWIRLYRLSPTKEMIREYGLTVE